MVIKIKIKILIIIIITMIIIIIIKHSIFYIDLTLISIYYG
jgi:hypothetical protein